MAKDHTTTLNQGLRSLVKSLDKKGALGVVAITEVWESVVGPDIAGHTFVSGIKDGELIVLVDSPVWAAELAAMAEQLRAKLQEETGQESVTSVRFNVSRRVGLEREERSKHESASRGYGGERLDPVPLTEQELRAVRRSVESIADTALREAALKATVADLEWKKAQELANSAQTGSERLQGTKKPR